VSRRTRKRPARTAPPDPRPSHSTEWGPASYVPCASSATSRPWMSRMLSRTEVARGNENPRCARPCAGFGTTGASAISTGCIGPTPTVAEVVNRQVEPVVVMAPSLTVAYHSYDALGASPGHTRAPLLPEGTEAGPSSVSGAEPAML